MSHKKARSARKHNSARPSHYKPRLHAYVTRPTPLWKKVLRIAFYIIITPMLIMAIAHYIKHYIHYVSR